MIQLKIKESVKTKINNEKHKNKIQTNLKRILSTSEKVENSLKFFNCDLSKFIDEEDIKFKPSFKTIKQIKIDSCKNRNS